MRPIIGALKVFVWLLLMFPGTEGVLGQTLFYQNYPPENYGAATQNFSVVEDDRGLIYVGNTEGVLEFDGTQWRRIATPALVRSLAVGNDGTIYVGTVGDFGKLVPGDKGLLQYQSLRASLAAEQAVFRDVWRIFTIGEDVYFSTKERLFRLRGGAIQAYQPRERFGFAHNCRDTVYVQEQGQGLLRLYDGEFREVPGTKAAELPLVYAIFPLAEDRLLLCTRTEGLLVFSLSENRILKAAGERYRSVNAILRSALPYNGSVLPDGKIALYTLAGGLILMSPDGELVNQLGEDTGLISDCIYQIHLDRNGQLWMATGNGVSAVAYTPSYVYLTRKDGLEGKIYSVGNHGDDVYIGTDQASYRLDGEGTLSRIPGTRREHWFMKSTGEELLMAHYPKGFLQLTDDGVRSLLDEQRVVGVALSEHPGAPGLLIGSTHNGFYIFARRSGQWVVRNRITTFDRAIYGASTDRAGNLWVRCAPNDLYRITFRPDLYAIDSVRPYEIHENGENITTPIPYRLADGRVVFGTDQGVFQYNADRDTFLRFPPMRTLRSNVSPIFEDRAGNLWYEESKNGSHVKGVFYREDRGWRHDSLVLQRFANIEMYKGPTNLITETEGGSILLGTTRGLIIHKPDARPPGGINYPTQVRRVYVNDTLHFSNGGGDAGTSRPLVYEENNVKFEYSALFYEENDRNTYSSRLLGRDSLWSPFAAEASRQYTNLAPGRYVFEVKARNLYQVESSVATYGFRILPPWYRTVWAYVGYVLLGVCLIALSVGIATRRQRRKNEQLERTITARTGELRREKERSEELSQNLLRVFTIIGHDLRRPVLAFQGITRKVNFLLGKKDFTRLEKLGDGIEEEARSLYQLTDNLLNWATTQKGTKPYNPALLPVREVFEEATVGMQKTFDRRAFELEIDLPETHVLYADRPALVTVFRNLLDNAAKFTPRGKKIAVTSKGSEQMLTVDFYSASPAIAPELLTTIFDAGVRDASATGAVAPGSGIGLHICRELMLLNHGDISVANAAPQGVIFTLTVPTKPTE